MSYPNYLVHFNKNHSKKNGQFISGDGDGDGTADEHHRYTKTEIRRVTGRRLNILDYRKNSKINKIQRARDKYAKEFGETEEGKKLRANTEKKDAKFYKLRDKVNPYDYYYGNKEQQQKYESDAKKADKALMDFWRQEKKELTAEGEYIAKSLIKDYGEKKVASLSFFDHNSDPKGKVRKSTVVYEDVDDLIKKYAEIHWKSGTYYNEDMDGPL